MSLVQSSSRGSTVPWSNDVPLGESAFAGSVSSAWFNVSPWSTVVVAQKCISYHLLMQALRPKGQIPLVCQRANLDHFATSEELVETSEELAKN